MKRLFPDSIAGRVLLALLAGLTLSHVISVGIYYGDRTDIVAVLGGSEIAERIASVTRVAAQMPQNERRRILKAANSPTLRITWDRNSSVSEDPPRDWRTRLMDQALAFLLSDVEKRQIRVEYIEASVPEGHSAMLPHNLVLGGPSEMMHSHMRRMRTDLALGQMLRVSLQLSDGTWLNFSAAGVQPASLWSGRFVLSLTLMILTVVLLAVWMIRHFTAPLEAFTEAASRLGRNVNAPALPESGPREVRRAAREFNEMQDRIRRFVHDRTQMVAAISHDLRTPITRLRLRADEIEDEEQQTKMLKDLEEMEEMISSVLSFAREDGEAEPQSRLDLAALLQSICDDMADAGRAVTMEEGPGLLFTGERLALKRAFTNLIDNAVKYGKSAHVGLFDESDGIRVQIDDEGPGIPEDEHEKVFASFYRLEQSRSRETGGAGLGLAFTRTIIRRHGGDITLHNRLEGGLRVVVTLPR